MAQYRLTEQAQRDLDAILEYIALESSVERAMSMFSRIRDGMRQIAESPGIGHFREDLLGRDFKFWRVGPYIIAYLWRTNPIKVIAIVHGARDITAFLEDRQL
jgi:toxin ParE1/3/4